MTKMLFVIDTLGSGGAQKSLVSFLNELAASEYARYFDVDLLLFSKRGVFLSEIPSNVHVVEPSREISCMFEGFGSIRFWNRLTIRGLCGKLGRLATRGIMKKKNIKLNDIQVFWTYWKPLIRQVKAHYDIAIGCLEGTCSYFVMDKVVARRKVLWFHNNYSDHGYNAEYDRLYYEKADKVITISNTCLQSLEQAFPGLEERFCVLDNITSGSRIRKLAKEFVGDCRSEGTINLLTIGRMQSQKGYDLLLDAANLLKQDGLDFVWRILGDGELKSQIEAKIRSYGLTENVKLLGVRSNPYPYISSCDIFVQTSRYEGKSIVLDEAKVLHRPIVVTNYKTVHDSIEDGKTGLICGMSGNCIADTVKRLAKEPALRDELSSNLAASFDCRGSSVANYLKVYTGAIQ